MAWSPLLSFSPPVKVGGASFWSRSCRTSRASLQGMHGVRAGATSPPRLPPITALPLWRGAASRPARNIPGRPSALLFPNQPPHVLEHHASQAPHPRHTADDPTHLSPLPPKHTHTQRTCASGPPSPSAPRPPRPQPPWPPASAATAASRPPCPAAPPGGSAGRGRTSPSCAGPPARGRGGEEGGAGVRCGAQVVVEPVHLALDRLRGGGGGEGGGRACLGGMGGRLRCGAQRCCCCRLWSSATIMRRTACRGGAAMSDQTNRSCPKKKLAQRCGR